MNNMLLIFLAFLAGAVIRFLLMWAFGGAFTIKGQLAQMIVVVVVGLGLAWLFHQINFSGWIGYGIAATCGFLSKYGLEWLNKKKG
jgi:hypothetical protein